MIMDEKMLKSIERMITLERDTRTGEKTENIKTSPQGLD